MAFRTKKLAVDITMMLLFPFLMAYQVADGLVHLVLGLVLAVCFVAHVLLELPFFRSLKRGNWTPVRLLVTVTAILLGSAIMVMTISGLMVSGWFGSLLLGRSLHLVSTAWAYLLMAFHIGIHAFSLLKGRKGAIIMCLSMLWGVYGCIHEAFGSRLVYATAFAYFSHGLVFGLDYLGIAMAGVCLGAFVRERSRS